uniref:Uncharacterized protein n=1 Tax=Piliocolobus tephrosceles TaxID=591936 RepID=A0A8C9GFN4_9PRIM
MYRHGNHLLHQKRKRSACPYPEKSPLTVTCSLRRGNSAAPCWQRGSLQSSNSQSRIHTLWSAGSSFCGEQIRCRLPGPILYLLPHPPPSSGGHR